MVIERTIASKVGEYGGIAICDERTVKVELTEAELEEAYRIRAEEYLTEDIKMPWKSSVSIGESLKALQEV